VHRHRHRHRRAVVARCRDGRRVYRERDCRRRGGVAARFSRTRRSAATRRRATTPTR
jgi:hypothetical protein